MADRYESFEFTAPAGGDIRFTGLQATNSFLPHLRSIGAPNNGNLTIRLYLNDEQIAEFKPDLNTGWGEYRVMDQPLVPNDVLDVEVANSSGGGITDNIDLHYTVED